MFSCSPSLSQNISGAASTTAAKRRAQKKRQAAKLVFQPSVYDNELVLYLADAISLSAYLGEFEGCDLSPVLGELCGLICSTQIDIDGLTVLYPPWIFDDAIQPVASVAKVCTPAPFLVDPAWDIQNIVELRSALASCVYELRDTVEMLLPVCIDLFEQEGIPIYRDDGTFIEYSFDVLDEYVKSAAIGRPIEIEIVELEEESDS